MQLKNERTSEPTLSQTFQLVSGPLVSELLARPDNRLGKLLERGLATTQIVDELFWTALSRAPTADELTGAVQYVDSPGSRRAHLEDLLWGLVNSNEFLLRR